MKHTLRWRFDQLDLFLYSKGIAGAIIESSGWSAAEHLQIELQCLTLAGLPSKQKVLGYFLLQAGLIHIYFIW
jgi:hypothetical protein